MLDYSFKPHWKASLGYLLILTLFVSLGLWQLRRADEKTALMDAREQRGQDAPIQLSGGEANSDDLRYRRVTVSGEYDPAHQFLLDNQVHDQKPGYQVLTPLHIEGSDKAVLVNRGWIPVGADRTKLPDIALHATRVQISGVADHFPGVGLRLKGAEIPAPGWPAVVQLPEPAPLSERLGYPVLPYQVLLEPQAEQGYIRAWREVRLTPEKNRGYALQWFLFAAVLTFFYVRYGLRAGSKTPPP